MRYIFEEEFRVDHPETVGETDRHFDLDNYKDWLEGQLLEARKQLAICNVSGRSEQLCRTFTPHRCPVCNGNGLVPNGFYMQTSGHWSTSSITPETCRSCGGTGVVWG